VKPNNEQRKFIGDFQLQIGNIQSVIESKLYFCYLKN